MTTIALATKKKAKKGKKSKKKMMDDKEKVLEASRNLSNFI